MRSCYPVQAATQPASVLLPRRAFDASPSASHLHPERDTLRPDLILLLHLHSLLAHCATYGLPHAAATSTVGAAPPPSALTADALPCAATTAAAAGDRRYSSLKSSEASASAASRALLGDEAKDGQAVRHR